MLRRGFDELAPREREILHLRFFEGLTQREIADARRDLADARLAAHPPLGRHAARHRSSRRWPPLRDRPARRGYSGGVADREHAEEPTAATRSRSASTAQLIELLNELRVAMPGVQVLFGFLLAVPFQQRFAEVDGFQRDVYLSRCSRRPRRRRPHRAERLPPHRLPAAREGSASSSSARASSSCGLVALAVAMNGAVLLVTDFIFGADRDRGHRGRVGSLFVWLWFGLGLWRRSRA